MGTERGETRGPGQPATGAAPKNLHGAEQGIVSRIVGVAAHRWREQGLVNHVLRQQVKERKAIADAELEHLRAKEWRAYAQATWKRLLPFFQLPGTITQDATLVQVELRPFNDRMLNRDLVILCDRVNQASPRLPDGRRLSFTIRSTCCILPAQKPTKIP